MSALLLQIPPHYIPALASFLRLPPEDLTTFLKALHDERPSFLRLEDLADSVAPQLSVAPDTVAEIVSVLASLYFARESLGAEVGDFVSGVRGAMERSGKTELQSGDWPGFESSLKEVLDPNSALSASAKATGLLTDNPRNYIGGRVLTDLRPVFGVNADEEPIAMAIVHNLKISYREGRDAKDFFVAMDSLDVRALRDLLERAVTKEESIRNLSKAKSLKLLEEIKA